MFLDLAQAWRELAADCEALSRKGAGFGWGSRTLSDEVADPQTVCHSQRPQDQRIVEASALLDQLT